MRWVSLRNEQLNTLAQNYANSHNNMLYIPSGLYHQDFIQAFADNVKIIKEKYGLHPKRIWIVGGTGIASLAVGLAFREAQMAIVQVGRPVWRDILDKENISYQIYEYTESKFMEPSVLLPPYQSLENFDAKVWYFVEKYGRPGDLIWNIK